MLKRAAAATLRALPEALLDLVALGGAAAMSYGAWLVYVPAGFIVGGILAMAGAVLLAARR